MEMPEEIWAYVCTAPSCPTQHIVFDYKEGATKYIRADLASPATDALVEALRKISRMKTLPDHAANTFTLSIAHQLADEALAAVDDLKGG
jgi:hypothetical protein